jgi:hypothetical protein
MIISTLFDVANGDRPRSDYIFNFVATVHPFESAAAVLTELLLLFFFFLVSTAWSKKYRCFTDEMFEASGFHHCAKI